MFFLLQTDFCRVLEVIFRFFVFFWIYQICLVFLLSFSNSKELHVNF